MTGPETVTVGKTTFQRSCYDSLDPVYRESLIGKPKIKILGFGGTIAMAPDRDGVLKPAKTVEQLIEQVPALRDMAYVSLAQLRNKDSTNITPNDWRLLARRIEDAQNSGHQGVIVTHGTDTMAYTAGAVALALGRGLKIPVVFTGAQLPLMAPGTDARFNVENAMQTVLEAQRGGIAEVMISFSDRVLRAARAVKISESKFTAFDSPAIPPLASITATGIHFQDFALKRDRQVRLNVRPGFARQIFTAEVVPGLDPRFLQQVIRMPSCKGLLLKSLGAGNVPSEGAYSLLPLIKEATGRNIPVLVSTKFVGGNTHMELYEPGKKALDMGAIPTGDMTDVMAQVKLMWLLGNSHPPYDLGRLKNQIATDYVGEITS